jgi:uncharacterized protein with HEPN domain
MPHNEDSLYDIYICAGEAVGLVQGMTRENFLTDRRTQLAVLHLITLMGEAARRTDTAFRLRHATLPWPQMVGMRNKVIHEYEGVDLVLVWDVLTISLPDLVRQLDPLIKTRE